MARVAEVEAWTVGEDGGSTSTQSGVQWLVTDQLGTPRMVIDQKGTLSGVKRYDYLPFGEEIGAGVGGRTTVQGYSQVDNVRQKFTGKERDNETGLDYFSARYYSSAQGRFTSVDPANGSVRLENPQTFNRYTYSLNNPLRYVDPDGRIPVETAIDVVSLALSAAELVRNPSLGNALYLVWDAGAVVLPYVPGSWVRRVATHGYDGLRAVGIKGTLANAHEIAVNNDYLRKGVALLSQGDDSTRQLLGLSRGDKAADFVGVTRSGEYVIGEAKGGSNIGDAVEQLDKTATRLQEVKGGNVKFSAEVVVDKNSKIDPGYRVNSQGQLEKFNVHTGGYDVQKAAGRAITVRFFERPKPVEIDLKR